MKHEFFPALVPYVIRIPKKRRTAWRHPTHWLNPEWADDFHPTSLVSYAHWRTFKEWDRVASENILFGDSGGYSVVTRDEKVDPERVMRWQLRRCHRGVMLDIPPYARGKVIQFSGSAAQYWEDSIEKSVSNVIRALPIYEEGSACTKQFRWWGVIQGETTAQMDEWHSRIGEVYAFDNEGEGWALAPKPSTSMLSVVRHLRYAHQVGIRNVHLLQVTKVELVGVAMALALLHDAFDLITYDSASATRCAINRTAIFDEGADLKFVRQRGNAEGPVHDSIMASDLWAAAYYQEAYSLGNDEWPYYLLLWNHKAMVRAFMAAEEMARSDPEAALRFFAGPKLGQVLREWAGAEQPKTQTRVVSLFDRI